jgi:hypothetical protein
MHAKLWSQNVKGEEHSEDIRANARTILVGWKVWTECIWLRIGSGGRLL